MCDAQLWINGSIENASICWVENNLSVRPAVSWLIPCKCQGQGYQRVNFNCEKAVAVGFSYRIRNHDLGGLQSKFLLKAGPTECRPGCSQLNPVLFVNFPGWRSCNLFGQTVTFLVASSWNYFAYIWSESSPLDLMIVVSYSSTVLISAVPLTVVSGTTEGTGRMLLCPPKVFSFPC